MAGNIQIPREVCQVQEIKVTDKSQQLYDFLTKLTNQVNTLQDRVKVTEDTIKAQDLRIKALESP